MNYDNPVLLDRLAAEYVLGTLHGHARQRFERLMLDLPHIRPLTWQWEQRLNPMAERLAEQTPSDRVWKHIQQRIDPRASRDTFVTKRLRFWRGLGLAASAAAIALLVYLGVFLGKPTALPQYVAIVEDQQSQPIWVISANAKTGQLAVKSVMELALEPGKSFELWVLPADGRPPSSLGLLPITGSVESTVQTDIRQLLPQSSGLAVSLEPTGGSPTGSPTGPVLYTTNLIPL